MGLDNRLQFNFWSTHWKSGPEARKRAFAILPRGDQMLARIEEHLSTKPKPIDAHYATMILRKGLDLTRELGIEAPDPFGRVRVMENPTISPQDAFARADSPFIHLRDALGALAAKENGKAGSDAYYFLSEPLYRLASTYDIAEWVAWPLCSSSDVDNDPTTAAYLLWRGGWSAGWDEEGLFLFDRRREFGLIGNGDRSSLTTLNEDYDYILKKLGSPSEPVRLSESQLAYAKQHLPPIFADFLKLYGYGAYFQNGFQFVDPQLFKPLAALIFKNDADFHPDDCHIVSYSAFGKLHAWSERYWLVTINLLEYQVWCRQLFAAEFKLPSHLIGNAEPSPERIASGLLPNKEDDRELWDTDQEPMFVRCVEEHGALQRGECFGFAPSLGLMSFDSRYRSVEHVKRYPALEHFAMIAQMQPFRLTRMGQGGYEYLREIG